MKKENNVSQKSKTTKKEMIKFLYKTKRQAKEDYNISYNFRIGTYSKKIDSPFTYGIR